MNLKTITFDADVYQLVPKVATEEMLSAIRPSQDASLKTRYLRLLFIAPQPETVSPWRDIESAPKDGTPFLVSGFNYGNDCGERWHDIGVTSKKGAVVSTINANNLAFATHWMPLPQPPETE